MPSGWSSLATCTARTVMGGDELGQGETEEVDEGGGPDADGPAVPDPVLQAAAVSAATATAPSVRRRLPILQIFGLRSFMAAPARSVARWRSLIEAYVRWGRSQAF